MASKRKSLTRILIITKKKTASTSTYPSVEHYLWHDFVSSLFINDYLLYLSVRITTTEKRKTMDTMITTTTAMEKRKKMELMTMGMSNCDCVPKVYFQPITAADALHILLPSLFLATTGTLLPLLFSTWRFRKQMSRGFGWNMILI